MKYSKNCIDLLLKHIATKVELYRGNMTRKTLSEISGVSAEFIFDVETGKQNISLKTLTQLCNALNIKVNLHLTRSKK